MFVVPYPCVEERSCPSGDHVPLVPLIESALGVELAWELIRESPAIEALAMGEADLRADLGVSADEGLLYARSRCIMAARAGGKYAIQSVFPDLHDHAGLRTSTALGRRIGFLGRSTIHPDQVSIVHEVLTPDQDEIARAIRILDELEAAHRQGKAVAVTPDGAFVDEAVARWARATLSLANVERRCHPTDP